jgi:hypothetical protein
MKGRGNRYDTAQDCVMQTAFITRKMMILDIPMDEDSQNTPELPSLPIEVMVKIFSFLTDPYDWGMCAGVSRTCRSIVEKFLLGKVEVLKFHASCQHDLEEAVRHGGKLIEIEVKGSTFTAISQPRQSVASSSPPNLQTRLQTMLLFTLPYLWAHTDPSIELIFQTEETELPEKFAPSNNSPLSQLFIAVLHQQIKRPKRLQGFHVLTQILPCKEVLMALITSCSASLQRISLIPIVLNTPWWIPSLVECPLTHLRIRLDPSTHVHRDALVVDFTTLSPLFEKQQVRIRSLELHFNQKYWRSHFAAYGIRTLVALLCKLPATPHFTLALPVPGERSAPCRWAEQLFAILAERKTNYSKFQTSLTKLTIDFALRIPYLSRDLLVAFPNLQEISGIRCGGWLIDQLLFLLITEQSNLQRRTIIFRCQLQSKEASPLLTLKEKATRYMEAKLRRPEGSNPLMTTEETGDTLKIHLSSDNQAKHFTIIAPFT